tara:strand:+ start:95 stop:1189 length:1095 start_codon:yes stop_codon:yes gene_type:complete
MLSYYLNQNQNQNQNLNLNLNLNQIQNQNKKKMSYINALKTNISHNPTRIDTLELRTKLIIAGQPINHDNVIQLNGIKLYHVPQQQKKIDQKATMELNMLLFGKNTDNNEEVIVNGNKLTPHTPVQEINLEIEEDSPFNHLQNPTECWADDDDDFTSPIIRTNSIVYKPKSPQTPQDPYPIHTPKTLTKEELDKFNKTLDSSIDNYHKNNKKPDVICIEQELDNTKFKIFECPDCKCYQAYTELEFFNHCCSNYHLDNVQQNLLKKNNPPLSCILMKSDNLFLDDVEQEFSLWKKSENKHIYNINKDNNNTKNICSYCKTFKLPFHNNHSYSNCPFNKTSVNYNQYMHKFSPLQKIDKNIKIIL